MCEELNKCWSKECFMAVAMLVRSILDHVPPIFGRKNFRDFYNNLQKSEKKYYQKLDDDIRDLADSIKHKQIDKTIIETPTLLQVDFRSKIDRLLGDILSELKQTV